MIRGEFDKAWEISEELERMLDQSDPTHVRHTFNRGWFLLNQGRFQEGFQALESGRFVNVYGSGMIRTTKSIWHPSQPIEGKRILLNLEGGIGDEIIQVRFAESLKKMGATVIVAADPSIHCLLKRVPFIDELISHEETGETRHDFWLPGFSACWVCGHTFENLPNEPFLTAKPESMEIWKSLITSDKIKVGIRWSGNPKFEHQQFRKFPAEPLIDLVNYPELQVYSLQRDNDLRELPEGINDLQHLMLSWEDTAAAIMNLDLVITSCTSIAHVSASLGKETWVIVPILPYHTWAYGSQTSPWYKTARVFRQQEFARWGDTFNQLHDELIAKYQLAGTHVDYNAEERHYGAFIQAPAEVRPERGRMAAVPLQSNDGALTMQNDLERDDYRSNSKKPSRKFVFVAGLPKSGANLIMRGLMDHPDVLIDDLSCLEQLFTSLLYGMPESEVRMSYEQRASVLRGLLDSYYVGFDHPVVVTKSVGWLSKLHVLKRVLGDDFKVICPVRNPAEILSALELERRDNPFKIQEADRAVGEGGSIAARCYHYAKPEGRMGAAHAMLLDATIQGFKPNMLFVDYQKLCGTPKTQLNRIGSFIGLEEHDYQPAIRKAEINTVAVIGLDLTDQYSRQIFWSTMT